MFRHICCFQAPRRYVRNSGDCAHGSAPQNSVNTLLPVSGGRRRGSFTALCKREMEKSFSFGRLPKQSVIYHGKL